MARVQFGERSVCGLGTSPLLHIVTRNRLDEKEFLVCPATPPGTFKSHPRERFHSTQRAVFSQAPPPVVKLDAELVDRACVSLKFRGREQVVLTTLDIQLQHVDTSTPEHFEELTNRDYFHLDRRTSKVELATERPRNLVPIARQEKLRGPGNPSNASLEQLQSGLLQSSNVFHRSRRRIECVYPAPVLPDDRLGERSVLTDPNIYDNSRRGQRSRKDAPAPRKTSMELQSSPHSFVNPRLDAHKTFAKNS